MKVVILSVYFGLVMKFSVREWIILSNIVFKKYVFIYGDRISKMLWENYLDWKKIKLGES